MHASHPAAVRGLSLVELMVILAVVAVLAGVGIPSYVELQRGHRLTVFSNELLGAMQLTRSEAIRRGHRVTLCTSADGVQCSAGVGWERGWIVFPDPNANASRDAGEPIIHARNVAFPGMVAPGNSTLARYLSYVPSGSSRAVTGALQMGTIRICNGRHERALILSATGRVRVERRSGCT